MAQVDNGPASGNGVLNFNGQGSLEVHIPVGLNPLAPGYAPYQSDPSSSYTGAVVNKVASGVQFSIPA